MSDRVFSYQISSELSNLIDAYEKIDSVFVFGILRKLQSLTSKEIKASAREVMKYV